MKASILSLALCATALALPVVEKRQSTGVTSNEFTSGGCRDVIFFFARGTAEPGNMGDIVGPEVSDDLKSTLGSTVVATQGVDYAAGVATNLLPGGADPAGVSTLASLLQQGNSQCPSSKVVVGGYSQGAAVVHGAISNSGLSSAVIAQIKGIVLFGDTQYQQNGGIIVGYPPSETEIYCAPGDLVCNGTLTITPAHLTYGAYAARAASFLVSRINAS